MKCDYKAMRLILCMGVEMGPFIGVSSLSLGRYFNALPTIKVFGDHVVKERVP
jgi:hypothetical protein